ncbi:MAG TPA: hypothetical protein PKE63_04610, partial [Lacibacter sp.]|nr:hypothetical protein [Lacibacter sp.]
MNTPEKNCRQCSKPLRGRCDKKFCDDYCRNSYNNLLRTDTGTTNRIRNINNSLARNRRILRELLPADGGMTKVHHDKLVLLGFHFKYHTHRYTNKKGQDYLFCYEYG